MLIIRIEFKSGQYHATPWGRNVNEGVTEFPPAPYRLIRAIIDAWKRKRPDWDKERVEPLLQLIASSPPKFYLPTAVDAFIKSYMSENKKDPTKKQLIYDSFISINPSDAIMIGWDGVTLNVKQNDDLKELLGLINYLGRSESWVDVDLLDDTTEIQWNSYSIGSDADTANMQNVQVAVPVSKREYTRAEPEWIDALMQTTGEMLKRRISTPFALRYVTYRVPLNRFVPALYSGKNRDITEVSTMFYSLESSVPPQITETVEIAERIHVKLMGIYGKISNFEISPRFSGRNQDGSVMQGHRHIFIFPLDSDGDGRLDHLMISCTEPFSTNELKSLDAMRSIWQSNGRPDISLMPIQWGRRDQLTFIRKTKKFRSETPFIPTRHYRKGRGDYEEWLINEVRHEARNHGLPEPVSVARIKKLERIGHNYYWLDFTRSRKGESAHQGYGFELEFTDPVTGPFSMGYGAHFGLGLFVPD